MADRYWVGGDGNWSDDDNHWATSSGGTPADGNIPGSGDNAIFDGSSGLGSGGTVTLDGNYGCHDMDWSGVTSSDPLYFKYGSTGSSSYTFSITGSFTGHAQLIIDSSSFVAYFKFTSTTTETITTNDCTIHSRNLVFDGSGGKWTFQDNALYWYYSLMRLTNGEVDINGNEVWFGAFYTLAGTKTLTLSGGDFHVANWYNNVDTGFTFNNTTGWIHINTNIGTSCYIQGTGSFYNLDVICADEYNSELVLNVNITVSNSCTMSGYNSTNRRLSVRSGFWYIARTFTCNGTLTVESTDFHYITGAGSASWDLSAITGLSGDQGGNSGITFTTAIDVYWYSGTGSWGDSKWYTATNGGGSSARTPLPQDNVYFDTNSFSGSATITINMQRLGRIVDMSGVDQSVSLVVETPSSGTYRIFGHLKFSTTISDNWGGYGWTLYALGKESTTWDLLTNNVLMGNLQMPDRYTSYRLTSDWNAGASSTAANSYNGEFDMNDYDMLTGRINYQYSGGLHKMGSGTLELRGIYGNVWDKSANAQIDTETSLIYFNPQSGSNDIVANFWGTATSYPYYNVEFGGIHTGTFTVRLNGATASPSYSGGSMFFNDFKINAGKTVRFYQDAKLLMVSFTAIGTSGNEITILSMNAGNQFIFKKQSPKADINCDYMDITDSKVLGILLDEFNSLKGDIDDQVEAEDIDEINSISYDNIAEINGIVRSAWNATNSTDNGNNTGWNITT